MDTDLQKASVFKRASAALFDFILLGILAVFFAFIISLLVGFDQANTELNSYYAKYEEEYGVVFDISQAEYEALEDGGKDWNLAYEQLIADKKAMDCYSKVVNLTLITISIGIFLSYLIVDFLMPLIFKNGQTLGKKIFGVAVMHTSGIMVNPIWMFIRTVLGKYTIETMIVVLIGIMIWFNSIGVIGLVVILLIGILQLILFIATPTNSLIHDLLAKTVVVDMASQRIFSNKEELIEFKKQRALEEAASKKY